MKRILLITLSIGLYYSCSSSKSLGFDPSNSVEKVVVKDESTAIIIYIKKGGNDTVYLPLDSLLQ